MARYITLPVTVSPVALLQRAYAFLQNFMPSWVAAEGNLDVWLLEATSTETAELVDIASSVPDTIFKYFGASLMQLPPIADTFATGHTTWYMRDNNGHTIPSGTQVAIKNSNGESIPFVTVNEISVPSGSTVTATGAVTIVAIQSGSRATGLGAPGTVVDLSDLLDFVDAVTSSDTTVGGVDAEPDDVYLDRLVNDLTLLTKTPILPMDFAVLARTVSPAYRTIALDTYNPADDTFNNPRMVTISSVDTAGEAVDTATKNAQKALLNSLREVNFIVNVMNPTYTTVNVTANVKILQNSDPAIVQTNVNAAIVNFLNPANWGIELQGTSIDPRDWTNKNILRKYDLSQAIHRVSGVQTIIPPLLLAKVGDTLAENDVTLNGRVSLPRAGTIIVTAS